MYHWSHRLAGRVLSVCADSQWARFIVSEQGLLNPGHIFYSWTQLVNHGCWQKKQKSQQNLVKNLLLFHFELCNLPFFRKNEFSAKKWIFSRRIKKWTFYKRWIFSKLFNFSKKNSKVFFSVFQNNIFQPLSYTFYWWLFICINSKILLLGYK